MYMVYRYYGAYGVRTASNRTGLGEEGNDRQGGKLFRSGWGRTCRCQTPSTHFCETTKRGGKVTKKKKRENKKDTLDSAKTSIPPLNPILGGGEKNGRGKKQNKNQGLIWRHDPSTFQFIQGRKEEKRQGNKKRPSGKHFLESTRSFLCWGGGEDWCQQIKLSQGPTFYEIDSGQSVPPAANGR